MNKILISHRGNINGKKPERENTIDYITEALLKNYNVEIDVWSVDGFFMLGHYTPQHPVGISFLTNHKLWCHAKTPETLNQLLRFGCTCFYHDKDDCVLTSNNYIWTYSGKELTNKSIAVLPEETNQDIKQCVGICSDFIGRYDEYK